MRLADAVEAVDGQLDPTATSDLTQESLSKLLWILTRQKPCTSIARLKVRNYADFNTRLRRVHERISGNNPRMQQVVALIRQEPVLQNEWVSALAAEEGFDDEWMSLDHPAVPKRSGKAASRVHPENQQTLPKMMATAVVSKAAAATSAPVVVPADASRSTLAVPVVMGLPPVPKAKASPVRVPGAHAPAKAAPVASKAAGPVHVPEVPAATEAATRPVVLAASLPAVPPPPVTSPAAAVAEVPNERCV